MSPERTCPDCGETLPADAPRGLCPECLVGAALPRTSTGGSAANAAFELASSGVLATIAQSIGPVPRVLLRDTSPGETPGPIVRPDRHDDPRTRYRIDGEIARGAMGVVLKGRDPDLGREVALNVPREDYRDNADVGRRFVEEAQIGGQLQHPGAVPIESELVQSRGRGEPLMSDDSHSASSSLILQCRPACERSERICR